MSESPRPMNPSRQSEVQTSLQEVISLAHAGAFVEARAAVIALLYGRPEDADAWFWLACVTESPWEALASLKKVQSLARRYPAALEDGIRWIQGKINAGETLMPMSAPYVPAATPRARKTDRMPATVVPWSRWALGMLSLLLIVALAAGATWVLSTNDSEPAPAATLASPPTAASTATQVATAAPTATSAIEEMPASSAWMDAWEAGDWATVIAQLEQAYGASPSETTWRSRLFDAHMKLAVERLNKGDLDGAQAEFDAARTLNPQDPELHEYRSALSRYQMGMAQYEAGDWQNAIQTLGSVLYGSSASLQSHAFLYVVHYGLGLAHQAGENLDAAEAEYFLAGQLVDDSADVDARLSEIALARTPPTPVPVAKRIEVSIPKQRFYAYEDDVLAYEFICSTGMHSSPTQPGTYEILDKIPMAYGSTWDLDMPYWMGIYWSGTLENGIHALPILSNGQLLWEGYLGQPASYGCVILSTEDAETIYNWAEVGIPVIIY